MSIQKLSIGLLRKPLRTEISKITKIIIRETVIFEQDSIDSLFYVCHNDVSHTLDCAVIKTDAICDPMCY